MRLLFSLIIVLATTALLVPPQYSVVAADDDDDLCEYESVADGGLGYFCPADQREAVVTVLDKISECVAKQQQEEEEDNKGNEKNESRGRDHSDRALLRSGTSHERRMETAAAVGFVLEEAEEAPANGRQRKTKPGLVQILWTWQY
ncbi:hypothetical protein ACA910_000667 [Epithemia clementina (nom. ined.)]